jgi:hypothetical protein
MSTALNRADHYHDLAKECRRLAADTFSNQMGRRYSWMAEIYTTLAEAEETRHAVLRRLTAVPVSAQKRSGRKLSAGCVSLDQGLQGCPQAVPQRAARVGSRFRELCLVTTVDEPDGSLANA